MDAPLPPALSDAARAVFGDRLDAAQQYADLLAGPGVVRGLIGPREAERVWDRHILNCAVVADLLPAGARVADIGSGAGLPGVPLALARLDVRVVLVEPMARRTAFLDEVVEALGLGDRVEVRRARAEDVARTLSQAFDVVTARAVARLAALAALATPLLAPGGFLAALKGDSVDEEVAELGAGTSVEIHRLGSGLLLTPTTVAVVRPPAHAGHPSGGQRCTPRREKRS